MRLFTAILMTHSVAVTPDLRAPLWLPNYLKTDFYTHCLRYLTEPYVRTREYTTKGDIVVSHDEYNSAWPGAQFSHRISFADLQAGISKFIPEYDGCVPILDFWIFRPSWYVPRRWDIEAARSCIKVILERDPAAIEENLENEVMKSTAVQLYRILRAIIPFAYSDEASWIIETEYSEESNTLVEQQLATRSSNEPELMTLRGIIEKIPALSQAIRQSDVFLEEFVLQFDPSTPDRRFLDRILASDGIFGYLIVQLPAFLDHHRSNLNAWRFVVNNMQEFGQLDAWATTSRFAVVQNPHFFSHRKIHSLYERGVIFEPLNNSKIGNAALYDLYDCVVQAAINGQLQIDPTDEASVTALLWQIRMVTSTLVSLDIEFRMPQGIASVFKFSGLDAVF